MNWRLWMIRFGWPKSPKALLEARYKAFKKGDIDFILESCHPQNSRDATL